MGDRGLFAEQIEFRWQPLKDLSPVASSLSEEGERGWASRLSGMINPAKPSAARGVPERSAAYHAFPDGSAALVWREYDEHASPLHGSTSRRPLVARALVGNAGLLKPNLAMVLCRADVVATQYGPAPGQAAMGERLPSISEEQLTDPARRVTTELDERARSDRGARAVVATALRARGTPLSVVLPGAELIQFLRDCPQLMMLWTLWRTTSALTAGPDGMISNRAWSFSTYEPPLGGTSTSGLGATVFRSEDEEDDRHHPSTARKETTVRPRSPAGDLDWFDEAAAVLVAAYRDLGSAELAARLREIARRYPGVDDRLRTVVTWLGHTGQVQAGPGMPWRPGAAPAEPGTVPPEHQIPVPSRDGGFQSQGGDTPGHRPEPSPGAPAVSSPEVFPEPVAAPPGVPAAGAASPGPPAVPAGISGHPGQPDVSRAAPRHRGGRPAQGTLTAVLDRIYHPRDGGEVEEALETLAQDGFLALPAERAKARNLMAGRGWYLPALRQYYPFRAEEELAVIFGVTVVPDLGLKEVAAQVTRWAREVKPEVVRALSQSAHIAGDDAVAQLGRALWPALHSRWLDEHGIYFVPAAPASRVPAQGGRPPRPRWQLVPNNDRAGAHASVLLWLCLILAAALAVTYMF